MAFDRTPANTGDRTGERPSRPPEPIPPRAERARLVAKAGDHLVDSLEADEPVEKNYHTRLALQALEIASAVRFD